MIGRFDVTINSGSHIQIHKFRKKVENDDKWYKNYTEQQRVEMGGGVIFNHANINNNTNVLLKEIVFFSFILQNLLHVALMTIMM